MKKALRNMIMVAGLSLASACGIEKPSDSAHKSRQVAVACRKDCKALLVNTGLNKSQIKDCKDDGMKPYNTDKPGALFDKTLEGNHKVYVSCEDDASEKEEIENDNYLVKEFNVDACDLTADCDKPYMVDASNFSGTSKEICEVRTRSIEVFCKDPNGNLQSGCEVKVEGQPKTNCVPSPTCTTDTKGRCSVDAPEGNHKVTVSKDGQTPKTAWLEFKEDAHSTATFRLEKK